MLLGTSLTASKLVYMKMSETSLKKHYLSPGKYWTSVLFGSGKAWKTVMAFTVRTCNNYLTERPTIWLLFLWSLGRVTGSYVFLWNCCTSVIDRQALFSYISVSI